MGRGPALLDRRTLHVTAYYVESTRDQFESGALDVTAVLNRIVKSMTTLLADLRFPMSEPCFY